MPSFGLPSSMPPGSSSLAPCMSTLVSSNISSCQETSSAPPGPDGCMSYLFGSPHLPPPPPLSLSDAAPYSPPPAYPTVFPFGPPLLPPARFPPPPSASFARATSNVTFFEGPQSCYPPEPPHIPYDIWSDRNVNSTSHFGGGDHMPKSFGHWPVPGFNSSVNSYSSNSNINNNNSNLGFLKSDTMLTLAPYPPVDSVTNFVPKYPILSGFPNAAGMPSIPSASVTSPLASGHFGAFPPPNLPLDFPHSSGSRYLFNHHASAFVPGLDPPPAFGPGNAEVMPEPFPTYLSRPLYYQSPSSFQSPDHFHDPPPPPITSSEIGSRPVTSETPSSFYGPPPETFHGSSNSLSHTFSSGPLCAAEPPPFLDFPSESPAPFTLPYPPPGGSLFPPYPSSSFPSLYEDSLRNAGGSSIPKRGEERKDRIVGETGKLMYQHMSPEEWRWKHYEPSFADALDSSGIFGKVRPSGYNHFNGIDPSAYSTVSNSSGGLVIKEEGSTSGASRSQKKQEEILEMCKAQNQSGPSLKLAASALAEMLASGSNGATGSTSRSMLSQVDVIAGTAVTSECGFHFGNAGSGGQTRSQRMQETHCSSSGSATFHTEARDSSSSKTDGITGRATEGYVPELKLFSLNEGQRVLADPAEVGGFCDFGAAPVPWAFPKASDEIGICSNSRPMSWTDAVPESAKDGAMHAGGQRRVFSKDSVGIMKQPAVSTGSAKLREVATESSASEHFHKLFSQACDFSSGPRSEGIKKCGTEPIGVQSSQDATSVFDPLASKVNEASGFSFLSPHQEDPSTGLSGHVCVDSSNNNDQWHGNSTSCGSSPPLCQAYLDILRGTSSRALPNLKGTCPERSSQNKGTYSGTGFHSLTASIANLSKVLYSLDSSAVRPPDSAALEETLQSSILRLSECLLLEQSRISRNTATRFVGSDDSAASNDPMTDRALVDFYLGRRAKNVSDSSLGHLKPPEVGILPTVRRSGSLSQLNDVEDITATIAALKSVDSDKVPCSVSKHLMNDPSSSSQSTCAVADEMQQFLWGNDIGNSSLDRLLDAAGREAELKALVERLKEELQQEREENKGTALLCEKILKETQVSKGNAVMQGVQYRDSESNKEQPVDSASQENTSGEPSVIRIGEVEALIPGRPALIAALKPSNDATGSKLREEIDTPGNSPKDEVQSKDQQVESQSIHVAQPTAIGPTNISESTSGSVKARLALLQARHSGSSHDLNGDGHVDSTFPGRMRITAQNTTGDEVQARLALMLHGLQSWDNELREEIDTPGNSSKDEVVSKDEQVESQSIHVAQPTAAGPTNISESTSGSVEARLALLQARQSGSSHDLNEDGHGDSTFPGPMRLTAQHTTADEIQAQLALILHGLHSCDNELGVYTETEPCTPANPAAPGNFTGFSEVCLKALTHMSSMLHKQSETISNMRTVCSQMSEQVNSKHLEKVCSPIQQKEVDEEIPNAFAQPFDESQAVEARAHLIRSRPDWTDGDVSESETEDSFDAQVYTKSVENYGLLPDKTDQFEKLNAMSRVRLLDSDVVSQSIHVKARAIPCTLSRCSSQAGATGETSTSESGNPAIAQDFEEDSSWEEVRFPLKDTE